VFPASRPSRGVVSCVTLGLPGHPPKGVVPRYPPRGVLRDCSRPVPGSCRGVVSPLTGGFPPMLEHEDNHHVCDSASAERALFITLHARQRPANKDEPE